MNVLRPPHTTHDLLLRKICYRFHPLYGAEVEVIRCSRKSASVILIVKVPGGLQIAVPEWMLIPQTCDQLRVEDRPRIRGRGKMWIQISSDWMSATNEFPGWKQPRKFAGHRVCFTCRKMFRKGLTRNVSTMASRLSPEVRLPRVCRADD